MRVFLRRLVPSIRTKDMGLRSGGWRAGSRGQPTAAADKSSAGFRTMLSHHEPKRTKRASRLHLKGSSYAGDPDG